MTRAVFCDRDGTLIRDADYPRVPAEVELLPGAAVALASLRRRGFRLVVISNQSGVGRGLISRQAFEAVHGRFVELLGAEGVTLDGAYYCLHAPAERPAAMSDGLSPTMYESAASMPSSRAARITSPGLGLRQPQPSAGACRQ